MMKKWKIMTVMLTAVLIIAMLSTGALSMFSAVDAPTQNRIPEWAVYDGRNSRSLASTGANLPVSYDLRSEGIVTPVKLQSPWDSCWSFGGVAIKYCADRSGKYAVSDSQNQAYFCEQYTFDDLSTDHDACIVGWDDNYDAANFSHTKDFNGSTLTNSEGTPLSEDDEVSFPLSYEQTKQRCEG